MYYYSFLFYFMQTLYVLNVIQNKMFLLLGPGPRPSIKRADPACLQLKIKGFY
jgi:hypothetical protein